MAKIVGSARHPVDLSDGRSVAPGEVIDGIDVDGDDHNKQLVADGRLTVLETPQPPAGPVPQPDDTSSSTGGSST